MCTRCIVSALVWMLGLAWLVGCADSQSSTVSERPASGVAPQATAMESHYCFRPAASPRGAWIVLLPGASGLKIFDDRDHYFRAASAFNAEGFDAIVVDYKAAYRASSNPPKLPTGGKIAWVAEEAVAWARRSGQITTEQPGAVVAWSLGAEGLWPLLGDEARVQGLNLKAAAAYYPSNEDDAPLRTKTPFLILTGEKDDVTEAKGIRAMVTRAASSIVTLHVYPNANHGFDVESITKLRTVSLIPLIGPSATFGFDADASRSAAEELASFFREHVR